MLHKARVDVEVAMEATRDVRQAWLRAQQHPGVPAFSGGLLDAWPKRMVDGFAVCNREQRMLEMYRATQVSHG